jgi:solute carrier family 25 folate transporter 32
MLKKRASDGDLTKPLSAPQYLICSAEASSHSSFILQKKVLTSCIFQLGAITAVITNPLWLVRVRIFTTTRDSPNAYRGLWGTSSYIQNLFSLHIHSFTTDGLSTIIRKQGPSGLFRGTSLALFGVSNGAIQFVVYEKMKVWGFERRRRQHERAGKVYNINTDKLVSPCNSSFAFVGFNVNNFSPTSHTQLCLFQVNMLHFQSHIPIK